MANAKKCDICGKFYEVVDIDEGMLYDFRNTSIIRVLKRNMNNPHRPHDVMHYDACDDCHQDVLDYILSKQAETTKGE